MKLLASALAVALTPAAALATYAVPAMAEAADEVNEANCQVNAVHASKEGDLGIPKELAFLEAQLRGDEFAIYKSFSLVDQKAFSIKRGKTTEVKFRSGNKMGLSLVGNEDTRLKLHINLTSRDGLKPLLGADYSINNKGLMMISAGSYEHEGKAGRLVIAIQCESRS